MLLCNKEEMGCNEDTQLAGITGIFVLTFFGE